MVRFTRKSGMAAGLLAAAIANAAMAQSVPVAPGEPGDQVMAAEQWDHVNISGATLFVDFFKAPASTNDFIDVDGDGFFQFNPSTPPYVDQLAPDTTSAYYTSTNPQTCAWHVIYRGVGSGNGLAELVNWHHGTLTMSAEGQLKYPSDTSVNNRTLWNPPLYDTHSGGAPQQQREIAIAVMDVPTTWFVYNSAGTPRWNATPKDDPATPAVNENAGYGNNGTKAWDANQSNKLKSLGGLNLNTASPDDKTVFDTQIAWVPVAFIANRGTGVENIDMSDLQHLFVTGRRKSGENLVGATRDSGSGTRNAAMNSIGVDPSWGRGDNLALKTGETALDTAKADLGPTHQATNCGGSSVMEEAVQVRRLAVGYTGLAGSSRAEGDSAGGKYEVLNVRKDTAGATQFVRPSKYNVLDNADAETGWQIGGAETFATVGDPDASQTGNPFIRKAFWDGSSWQLVRNVQAESYIRNLTASIAAAEAGGAGNDNMPGEYLAAKFFLNAALDAVPSDYDPTLFVANNVNQRLQNWMRSNNTLSIPDYGSVNVAGRVPLRVANPSGYNDGSTNGAYTDSSGAYRAAGATLSLRNRIAGDFNYAGTEKHVRNVNDIAAMMQAVSNWQAFEAGNNNGGDGYVIVHVIGDFNGDGDFDADDIRYFADGLAIDPATGNLDRKQGFTRIDEAWAALTGNSNYFGTAIPQSLVDAGATYTAGASRADVAGNPAQPGANPTGADGEIDYVDVDYVKANFGDWSNLDEACTIDLSCDMNGDLVVDMMDLAEMWECMGSHYGDIDLDGSVNIFDIFAIAEAWNTQKGDALFNPDCDLDNDGSVTIFDIFVIAENWNS